MLFLDHRLLSPGDIVLQRGTGVVSTVVAAGTGSPFSHAQLVITRTIVYEALADGVFPTTFSLEPVMRDDGSRLLAIALPGVRRAAIYRHVTLAGLPEGKLTERYDFEDCLLEITGALRGRPYANLVEVLGAGPQALRPLSGWLKSRLRRGRLDVRERGIFCSELVARVMDTLGFPLFTPAQLPGTLNPGALASSPFLAEVPGAVFAGERGEWTDEDRRLVQDWEANRQTREQFVETDRLIKKGRKLS